VQSYNIVQSYNNYIILFCVFVTGFLVSRIFIKTGLASSVVIGFTRLARGHMSYLLLILIGSSAFLSSFIPNTLTVLTLIPLLRIIDVQYHRLEERKGQLSTPLVMSIIYGSNIGGMSSITGSPANVLLLGFLPIIERNYQVSIVGRENINFFSWLTFGIPTAILLILVAWVLIYVLLVPKKLRRADLDFSEIERIRCPRKIRSAGLWLSVSLLATWITVSVLQTYLHTWGAALVVFSVIVSAALILYIFVWRIKAEDGKTYRILLLRDCYLGLPTRGMLLAVGAAILSGIFMLLKVPGYLGSWLTGFDLARLARPLVIYIIIALFVTFITEFLSNTTVALTFFPIIYVLTRSLGLDPLSALLLVSLSTTCAFMSPIATPVNALAFGSLKNVSLRKMLLAGFFMNLFSATWLAWSVRNIVPAFLTGH
jgi:sodium-dependent dicarboxylate transporter 2/3/5